MKTKSTQSLVPNERGSITLVAEEPDDIWIAYNLITKNDVISTETSRKVQLGHGNGDGYGNGGGRSSECKNRKNNNHRVKVKLDIKAMDVEYEKDSSILRVKGKIIHSSNSSVMNSGVFHTLEIQLNQSFEFKEKMWNSKSLELLKQAMKKRGGNGGSKSNCRSVRDDAKISEEEKKLFRNFTDTIDSDNGRACYGLKMVEAAIELMAVERILVTDDLFKSSDVKIRIKYENLVDLVKESGGMASVFSSGNASGKELAKMTGVAAILRFPLPDLDYTDDDFNG